jgi:hypothetical protein
MDESTFKIPFRYDVQTTNKELYYNIYTIDEYFVIEEFCNKYDIDNDAFKRRSCIGNFSSVLPDEYFPIIVQIHNGISTELIHTDFQLEYNLKCGELNNQFNTYNQLKFAKMWKPKFNMHVQHIRFDKFFRCISWNEYCMMKIINYDLAFMGHIIHSETMNEKILLDYPTELSIKRMYSMYGITPTAFILKIRRKPFVNKKLYEIYNIETLIKKYDLGGDIINISNIINISKLGDLLIEDLELSMCASIQCIQSISSSIKCINKIIHYIKDYNIDNDTAITMLITQLQILIINYCDNYRDSFGSEIHRIMRNVFKLLLPFDNDKVRSLNFAYRLFNAMKQSNHVVDYCKANFTLYTDLYNLIATAIIQSIDGLAFRIGICIDNYNNKSNPRFVYLLAFGTAADVSSIWMTSLMYDGYINSKVPYDMIKKIGVQHTPLHIINETNDFWTKVGIDSLFTKSNINLDVFDLYCKSKHTVELNQQVFDYAKEHNRLLPDIYTLRLVKPITKEYLLSNCTVKGISKITIVRLRTGYCTCYCMNSIEVMQQLVRDSFEAIKELDITYFNTKMTGSFVTSTLYQTDLIDQYNELICDIELDKHVTIVYRTAKAYSERILERKKKITVKSKSVVPTKVYQTRSVTKAMQK